MFQDQKQFFDIPPGVAYFDCATLSPLLRSAHAAVAAGLARELQPWRISSLDFLDCSEPCRAVAASLVDASADEIAFVPGAAYGAAIAARNVPVARGQEVLVAAGQHTASAHSWRKAAAESGASVRTVAAPEGEDWTAAILEAISPRTAVAAIAPFHSSDGRAFDLPKIRRALNAVGAALVVDATHSLGARRISVRDFDPDFFFAGCYKWLLGPFATGILYAAPRWHDGRSIEEPGLNRRDAYDFANNTANHEAYLAGARRYDCSGRGAFGSIAGLEAALRHVAGLGIARIETFLDGYTRRMAAELGRVGIPCLSPPAARGHYASVEFPKPDAPRIAGALKEAGVYASARNGWLRLTPHVYNTDDDLDRLVEGARKAFS